MRPVGREERYLEALERARNEFLAQGGFEGPPTPAHHCFETFVPGTSVNQALQACRAVCDHPGALYNPLFIYGTGKTHLLDAIRRTLATQHPGLLVLRTSGEMFGDELLTALGNRWFERFRLKYRHVDVLLLDAFPLKRGQEEFQVILDHLLGQGRQVVITSSVPVRELDGISEGLRSLLGGGLTVEMTLPSLEMRKTLVPALARRHELDLPRDVAFALARRLQTDVRGLEGAVLRICAWHRVQPRPWESIALDVLCSDAPVQATASRLTQEDILDGVSEHFGLDAGLLRQEQRRRTPDVTRARRIAMYLCRTMTGDSQEKVARTFDATAAQVRYAVGSVQGQEGDPVLARDLERIRALLAGEIATTRAPGRNGSGGNGSPRRGGPTPR